MFYKVLLLTVIFLFIAVMFYTMLERKILSYVQSRRGPKKIGMLGLLTPIFDGVKVMTKSASNPSATKKVFFFLLPLVLVGCLFGVVMMTPQQNKVYILEFSTLVFVVMTSMGGLALILSSMSSSKKFAHLGGLRIAMKVLSYEVFIILLVLCVSNFKSSYSLLDARLKPLPLLLVFPPLFMCWMISGLLELNRTPFDLAEGESELVSGIKVEYGGMGFVAFYLPEYGHMVVFSVMTCYLWF